MAQGRAARMAAARQRDGDTCVWCGTAFDDRTRATREHVIPRVKGGPSWLENEVAACRRCNGERGHRALVEWLDECERRGWQPDVPRLERVLVALQGAIAERGGQRRARPQLDAQLRRLRKRTPPARLTPQGERASFDSAPDSLGRSFRTPVPEACPGRY